MADKHSPKASAKAIRCILFIYSMMDLKAYAERNGCFGCSNVRFSFICSTFNATFCVILHSEMPKKWVFKIKKLLNGGCLLNALAELVNKLAS